MFASKIKQAIMIIQLTNSIKLNFSNIRKRTTSDIMEIYAIGFLISGSYGLLQKNQPKSNLENLLTL